MSTPEPLGQGARAELTALRNDALNMRGALSPNGFPRRVPMEPGPELAPVVEWLLAEVDRLRIIEVSSIGAHALLADAEQEVARLRAELGIAFGPSMYFDIQKVLDAALGTEKVDGAGEGIVADVALLAKQKRAAEAERDRLRAEVVKRDDALGEELDERNRLEGLLDKFAAAVAPVEVIGEHSSGNDPWANALDMVTPASEVDRLRQAIELLGRELAARHAPAETDGAR